MWFITDKSTVLKRPTFFSVNTPTHGDLVLGPFIYSCEENAKVAQAACLEFTKTDELNASLQESKTTSDILGFILNEEITDIFFIDQNPIACTLKGAIWVQKEFGVSSWYTLFTGSKQDERLETTKLFISSFFEGKIEKGFTVRTCPEKNNVFWTIRTDGLESLNFPNLELRQTSLLEIEQNKLYLRKVLFLLLSNGKTQDLLDEQEKINMILSYVSFETGLSLHPTQVKVPISLMN